MSLSGFSLGAYMHKINTVHKNWVSAQIEKAPEIQGVSILRFG